MTSATSVQNAFYFTSSTTIPHHRRGERKFNPYSTSAIRSRLKFGQCNGRLTYKLCDYAIDLEIVMQRLYIHLVRMVGQSIRVFFASHRQIKYIMPCHISSSSQQQDTIPSSMQFQRDTVWNNRTRSADLLGLPNPPFPPRMTNGNTVP